MGLVIGGETGQIKTSVTPSPSFGSSLSPATSQRMLAGKEDLSQMLHPHVTPNSTPPKRPQEEAEVLGSWL